MFLSFIFRTFNTCRNNLQTRVTKLFSKALQAEKIPLSTQYGALVGLGEQGQEVRRLSVIIFFFFFILLYEK